MSLELVSFVLCPYVQRAVITLKEKNVDFRITYIDLENPPEWFRKISPLGKVPLLRIDEDTLFESSIINEYLDESYPPKLHPENPLQRAKHRGWIEFGSNLLFEQLKVILAKDEDGFRQQSEVLGGLFARLALEVSAGPYFSGNSFALIDAAYAPFFMRFEILKKYNEELVDLMPTRLDKWGQALLARPTVQHSVVEDFEQLFVNFCKNKGSYIFAEV